MHLLRRAEAGNLDVEQLECTSQYIGNYQDIQRRLAKRGRNLRFYDDLVLQMLTAALKQL